MKPIDHNGNCQGCGYKEGHDANCVFAPSIENLSTEPMIKKATVIGIQKMRSCMCGKCFGGVEKCHYCSEGFRSSFTHCPFCGCPKSTLNPDYNEKH